MIEDARVLREAFVPNDVVHRDGEVDALSAVLEPVVAGEPPESALLTGPSGAGKTTIAKFVVGRLRETALDVESIHVNCWQSYTRFKALYRILEGLGRTIDVHRQSTPHDELLDRLEAYDGPPVIVTLDEVDQLEDGHLIYDLYRLPAFAVVLITNDEEELLAGLDERVRSRLHTAETIHFDRYDVDELTDIMADRDGADAIAESHIEAAIPEARREVRSRALDSLHKEQRQVLEILQDSDGLPPREIYDRYVAAVEDPRTKRTVRSWLQKLAQYNLVEADGSGPDRTYRVTSS